MSVLAPPRPPKTKAPVGMCVPMKGDDDGKCHSLVTWTRALCGKTWPRGTWSTQNTHRDGRLGACGRPPCPECARREAAGL